MDRHMRRIGTNVLLIREGKVFLARRCNSGWEDGRLGIPGGHLEEKETARGAAVREMQEELGLAFAEDRLHYYTTAVVNADPEYLFIEFCVNLEAGEEPQNLEPDKCSEFVWVDPHNLPDDVPAVFRDIIEKSYLGHEGYIEVGY